jgi:hypothetical protein
MRSGRDVTWLGLTPEPERELPAAVATLRRRCAVEAGPAEAPVPRDSLSAERRRVEGLVLHGTHADWLRYLGEVTALVTRVARRCPDPEAGRAALRAAETVLDHHRMLIGLPGPAYDRVATARADLTAAIATLRDRLAGSLPGAPPPAGAR